jgi:tetratricopeptide (TPR) repeat protein
LWLGSPSPSRFDKIYAVIFGLLFIPKNYYNLPVLPEANFSVVLNPLLMIVFIVLIMVESVSDLNWLFAAGTNIARLKALPLRRGRLLFPLILSVLLVVSAIILTSAIPKRNNGSIIPDLQTATSEAEKQMKWWDAKSYYYQWIIADPANPLPRLRLADILSSYIAYNDAFRLYQKVLWLPNISQEIKEEAEVGLQLTLGHAAREMIFLHQYQQARLLIQEYEMQFPYLPEDLLLKCELTIQWAFDNGAMSACYSDLQKKYPYQIKDLVSHLGTSKSQNTALAWLNSPQPNIKAANQLLGWSYLFDGENDKAIDAFKQVLQTEPDKSAYQGLSMSYLRAGNMEGLCNTLNLWKFLDPLAPTTLKVTGYCTDVK